MKAECICQCWYLVYYGGKTGKEKGLMECHPSIINLKLI